MEIRADAFTEEPVEETTTAEGEQTINIEELAVLVAAKVIEALKTEEKAEEETEEPAEKTTEEQTEEQTEEVAEEETTEEEAEETTEEETEEQTEESRSIDYSAFEERLSKIMK